MSLTLAFFSWTLFKQEPFNWPNYNLQWALVAHTSFNDLDLQGHTGIGCVCICKTENCFFLESFYSVEFKLCTIDKYMDKMMRHTAICDVGGYSREILDALQQLQDSHCFSEISWILRDDRPCWALLVYKNVESLWPYFKVTVVLEWWNWKLIWSSLINFACWSHPWPILHMFCRLWLWMFRLMQFLPQQYL